MTQPASPWPHRPGLIEAFELCRTVEFVTEARERFRIEILESFLPSGGDPVVRFTARYFEEQGGQWRALSGVGQPQEAKTVDDAVDSAVGWLLTHLNRRPHFAAFEALAGETGRG